MKPRRKLGLLWGCAAILALATTSAEAAVCVTDTADMPPLCQDGSGYQNVGDSLHITDGLPPGSQINIDAENKGFFNITRSPGGILGGEVEDFSSMMPMHLTGTGVLSGYDRLLAMQLQNQTHIGPRNPSEVMQSFPTDYFLLQGQLPPGDPDFDLLRITAGDGFGLPSPGHTTLTQLEGGKWNVDSFFDITYRIDFIGSPGGPLAGRSGSTTGTIRMQAGQTVPEPSSLLLGLGAMGVLGMRRGSRLNRPNAR